MTRLGEGSERWIIVCSDNFSGSKTQKIAAFVKSKGLVPVGAEGSCPLLQCVVELLWVPTKLTLNQQIHLPREQRWDSVQMM